MSDNQASRHDIVILAHVASGPFASFGECLAAIFTNSRRMVVNQESAIRDVIMKR